MDTFDIRTRISRSVEIDQQIGLCFRDHTHMRNILFFPWKSLLEACSAVRAAHLLAGRMTAGILKAARAPVPVPK